MKVNELMAGNYVMVNGEIHQVYEINGEMHTVELWDTDTAELECDLEPILLTDEILDKNFERKEHGWQVKDCWKIWANPNYGYILATLFMDGFGGGNYEPCIPCTYLHELQNAMTVLRAGKEIKP